MFRQPEERSGNSISIVDFILCSAHHHIIFDLNQYKQKAENSRLLTVWESIFHTNDDSPFVKYTFR